MLVAKSELTNYATAPLYDERTYDEKKEEQRRIKREKTLKMRKRQRMIFKLACISSIALFTIVSLFILKGYSTISETRMNITSLEKRKNELEQTKFSMISELEEAKSSVKISEEAMYKLSMDYPNSDQVVYLSLGESNDEFREN